MQSDTTMGIHISSTSWQILRTARSWLLNSIGGFPALFSIWTETKNDGDTLKIRKKGEN